MKYITLIIGLLVVGCVTDTSMTIRNRRVQEVGEAFERGDINILQRQNLMNEAFLKPYGPFSPISRVIPNSPKASPKAATVIEAAIRERKLTAEEKKVVGSYEWKGEGNTIRMVLLESGIAQGYENGKKHEAEAKWKISKDGELHIVDNGVVGVFRINKDRSVTLIAAIAKDGKQKDFGKEGIFTYKKIK